MKKELSLRTGSPGWFGRDCDEYGRHTTWAGIPKVGRLIWFGRLWTWEELLAVEDNREFAEILWDEWALTRRTDGLEDPMPGEPDFSSMTYEEILDWRFRGDR